MAQEDQEMYDMTTQHYCSPIHYQLNHDEITLWSPNIEYTVIHSIHVPRSEFVQVEWNKQKNKELLKK